MENDEGFYDYWKKNTLKIKGKIILIKTFSGEIVVEKLFIEANESPVGLNYY